MVVDAQTKGPLKDMLGFVGGSPLDAMTGQALARPAPAARPTCKLHLELPIHSMAKSKVQGSVTLAGNDVQMSPGTPLLGKAQGVVSFTEGGFAITGGQARMLGGDIRIEGGMRAPTAAQPDSPDRDQGPGQHHGAGPAPGARTRGWSRAWRRTPAGSTSLHRGAGFSQGRARFAGDEQLAGHSRSTCRRP